MIAVPVEKRTAALITAGGMNDHCHGYTGGGGGGSQHPQGCHETDLVTVWTYADVFQGGLDDVALSLAHEAGVHVKRYDALRTQSSVQERSAHCTVNTSTHQRLGRREGERKKESVKGTVVILPYQNF